MIRRPPRSTLFPYTSRFRSRHAAHRPLNKAKEKRMSDTQFVRLDPNKITIGANVRTDLHADAKEFARSIKERGVLEDRKSTRLNSSHANISYAVFCLKTKNT